MNTDPESNGDLRVIVGPWAKLIMGVSGTLLAAGAMWLVASVNTLITQQAVVNERLLLVTGKLDAVSTLSDRVMRLEYKVQSLEDTINSISNREKPNEAHQ